MFSFDPIFVQAEVDYRAERVSGSRFIRRNRTRVPFAAPRDRVSRRAR